MNMAYIRKWAKAAAIRLQRILDDIEGGNQNK